MSKEKDISELVQISDGVNQVIDRMEKLSIDKNAFRGIKTGFPTLDNYIDMYIKSKNHHIIVELKYIKKKNRKSL